MKQFFLGVFSLFTLFARELNYAPKARGVIEEKPIVVIVPSYNNKSFYQKNLESIFSQNYSNFRVIYTNDASSDGTGELVEAFVKAHGYEHKIKVIHNAENKGCFYNVYHMIHSCSPEEIVCKVDGDDWLNSKNALKRVNQAYADDRVWMTYGSDKSNYQRFPHSKPAPVVVLKKGKHRNLSWRFSHMRTFYAGLYQSIPKEHWLKNGEFYSVSEDTLQMMYLIDRARDHVFFIPEIIYFYNTDNPINDFKIKLKLQQRTAREMRRLPPIEGLLSKEEFLYNGE
ncbi:glycosyltransferase family 2 protein [bacterium]|nr:glycosyltransferase family 2 protein [bacterium]